MPEPSTCHGPINYEPAKSAKLAAMLAAKVIEGKRKEKQAQEMKEMKDTEDSKDVAEAGLDGAVGDREALALRKFTD